jgi:membrane protein
VTVTHTNSRSTSPFQIVKGAWRDFSDDQCGLRAAALSYYTVFALPPLLILLIKIAGLVWDPAAVQRSLETQFGGLVGSGGASQVQQMITTGQQIKHGVVATVVSVGGLLLGATGAFLSLQSALNAAWEVKPDPKQGGIKQFVLKRMLSFGMVMGLAFLLVVSLAITAAVSALGRALGGASAIMQIVNLIVSTAVLALMFAAIFKFLPDAVVRWRSVWVGGIATAVLFEIGKFVLGLYLGHSNPGNAFGAASALAVIFVWVYYAGMLVLFGAEFTQQFAKAYGHGVQPKKGAVRVEREERIVRAENAGSRAEGGDMQQTRSNGRANWDHLLPPADGNSREDLHDASIGELFKRLSADGGHLIQQEIQLAKAELQENAARAAKAGGKIGVAAAIALPGIGALIAALVIGLGILLNSYWVSALIVGIVVLAIAGFLAKGAINDFKQGLAPRETVRTVRDDVSWAKRETVEVKRELTASPR